MKLAFSRQFVKQAKKLPPAIRERLQERIALFLYNPLHAQLQNHSLKGPFQKYRSINITGDIRALYLQQGEEAIFDAVGTHSQLYG
jgi:addiction module RelE/StbE family toxin